MQHNECSLRGNRSCFSFLLAFMKHMLCAHYVYPLGLGRPLEYARIDDRWTFLRTSKLEVNRFEIYCDLVDDQKSKRKVTQSRLKKVEKTYSGSGVFII